MSTHGLLSWTLSLRDSASSWKDRLMQEKHLEPNTTQWFIKYTWGDSMYKFSKSLSEEKSVLVGGRGDVDMSL